MKYKETDDQTASYLMGFEKGRESVKLDLRQPLSRQFVHAAWKSSCEACDGKTTLELIEHFARLVERAHGIKE